MPIPERRPRPGSPRYRDLGDDYARFVRDPARRAHLDPDLVTALQPRDGGWRGLFGQCGAAASHLLGRGVGAGDLFLFFGLFREATADGFARGAKPFHAIWGYLEVAERVNGSDAAPTWARNHPHFADPERGRPNVVFVARAGGFGLFRYRDELRLTRPGSTRVTDWRLPECFDSVELTYHSTRAEAGSLRAASRGQEFVCEANNDVAAWARNLVARSDRWS